MWRHCSHSSILEGVECYASDPGGGRHPEATLEWLRLHTLSQDVPLIFYERGLEDGVYTHVDRQRAYGSPEFAEAIQETVLRLGFTDETLITSDDVVRFSQ